MDGELFCNYKRCQVALKNKAWATYCYHIFCNEHFPICRAERRCPVCSSDLIGKGHLFPVTLCPSMEEKSMSLIGLSPSNILQVCFKAMSFWKFQMCQEKLYLTSSVKHLRSRLAKSESFHEEAVKKLNNLIQQERVKCNNLQKDLDDYIKKTHNLEVKIDGKNRQLGLYSIHKQLEALRKQDIGNSKSNRNEPRRTNNYKSKVSPNITSQMHTLDMDCDNILYHNSQQLRGVCGPTFSFNPNI